MWPRRNEDQPPDSKIHDGRDDILGCNDDRGIGPQLPENMTI
jgi:hypothetical protein